MIRLAVATILGACGDNLYETPPYWAWTGEPVALGAYKLDGLLPDDSGMLGNVERAAEFGEVVLFYGHNPPIGTSYETIDALLSRAEQREVAAMSFAELAVSKPQSAVCLSFDDTEVDAWYLLAPLLARHRAHVSFFVTEYAEFTDDQRSKLHELYANQHSIEAHGVHHIFADDYIPEFGLQSYIANEVLPSIEILRDDGFTPVAYAHPGGGDSPELNEALAQYITFVRDTSGRPR